VKRHRAAATCDQFRSNAAKSIANPESAIPQSMLCGAMPPVRRAMAKTPETRSRRSTSITTSAASDEALAPRAPIAIPTLAAASAGASLMPSPTLPAGSLSARAASRSSAAPIGSAASARSSVTMTIARLQPFSRRSSNCRNFTVAS
jgi:hypothetical protein